MNFFIPLRVKLTIYTLLFVIASTLSMTYIYENYSLNTTELIEVILVIISISILVNMFVLKSLLSNPLKQLRKALNTVANGKYSHQIDTNQKDEIGLLFQNFNRMAQNIERRESELDSLAYQDELTKIPNRVMFLDQLDYAISRAKRLNTKIAVFFIDIDEFKVVNDTLGHDIGDKLLIGVATNLIQAMRKNDLLARIGGDEFNVLVEDLDSALVAEHIAQKIINQIQIPLNIDGTVLHVTGSVGVSIFPIDAHDSTTLLKNADLAMYDAKGCGKNRYRFFNEELSISLKNRALMLREMKLALEKNEMKLYYQPKFSLKDGSIYGAEALIRWDNPILGFVKPEQFISLAEESAEIIEIGAWIVEKACNDFVSWKKLGLDIKQVSINISNVQFAQDDILKVLKRSIKSSGIDPRSLEVEITESYIQENSKEALNVLHKIRELGVDLAMDDFGTGYSSMSYLKRLPLTRLKIDKTFIDEIPHNNDDVEITKIIVALAKVMNLSITAEGIETVAQLRFLQELKCDEGQGYLCSKPLPYSEFVEFLKHHDVVNF